MAASTASDNGNDEEEEEEEFLSNIGSWMEELGDEEKDSKGGLHDDSSNECE